MSLYSNGTKINEVANIEKLLLDIDKKLNNISTIEEMHNIQIEILKIKDNLKTIESKITKIFNLTDNHNDKLLDIKDELVHKPSIKYLDELMESLRKKINIIENQHIQEEGVKKGMSLLHKLYVIIIGFLVGAISFFNGLFGNIIEFIKGG